MSDYKRIIYTELTDDKLNLKVKLAGGDTFVTNQLHEQGKFGKKSHLFHLNSDSRVKPELTHFKSDLGIKSYKRLKKQLRIMARRQSRVPKMADVKQRPALPEGDWQQKPEIVKKNIKKCNKRLKKWANSWPVAIALTWNKAFSRFTFELEDGRKVRTDKIEFVGASKDAERSMIAGGIRIADGIPDKTWTFFNKRNREYIGRLMAQRRREIAELESVRILPENGEKKSKRTKVFGFYTTEVLRALGRANMTFKQAHKVLKHFGIKLEAKTIKGQLWCGRARKKKKWVYNVAELSEDQLDELFIIGGEE